MPVDVQVKATEIYQQALDTTSKINLFRGGAGSGKSYAVAQKILLHDFVGNEGNDILITCKTMPHLKETAILLCNKLLDEYNINCHRQKTDLVYTFGSNRIKFMSLDKPEKAKSTEYDVIWMEETTDFTLEDFLTLRLRLKRSKNGTRLYGTFNPISAFHWIKTEVIDKDPSVREFVSNYKMNPFMSDEAREELESLKEKNPNYYNIFALGEWGVLENTIYSNWDTCESMPTEYDEVIYGIDYGFENPSVLVEVRIKENHAYIDELIFKKHLTNTDFIEELNSLNLNKSSYFYADCAEPARIQEMYQARYNVQPAEKDVIDGIDSVLRYKLHITKRSVNTIKEINAYSRKKDKNNNVIDEPVKYMDHSMDAIRYAIHTYSTKGGIAKLWHGL